MSNYIATNSISVFPSALRMEVSGGKFTSEDNLTGIIRTIAGKESFYRVVDSESSEPSYIIVIHGYCFLVTGDLPGTFANIRLDNSGRLAAEDGGAGLDSGGFFKGLYFTTDRLTGTGIYSLELSPENMLYTDASSLFGVITVDKGGTGATNLTNVTVGSATTATNATNANISVTTTNDVDTIKIGNGTSYKVSNAENATKLKTARTINGTNFDGSANITTANWGTARNISIASSDGAGEGAAVSVNGSGDITLKLPSIITASVNGKSVSAGKLLNGSVDYSVGSTSNPVYFSGGVPMACGTIANATTASKLGSDTVGATNRIMYLNNGSPAEGMRFFVSSSAPTGANVGDIWFSF